MSYSQALERQLQWRRWLDGNMKPHPVLGWDERIRYVATALDEGETFYWSRQVSDIVVASMATLPVESVFRTTLLPTGKGFFWFDRGAILGKEGTPPWVRIEALVWSTGVQRSDDRLTVQVAVFTNQWNEPTETRVTLTRFVEGESMLDTAKIAADECVAAGDRPEITLGTICLFFACLLFLQQRILITSEQRAERPTRKRLERVGFMHEPLVRVVELRRKQARSEQRGESEPVEWSHQWVVSGHWRQQWYPSLNDNQPIWVMPYIKGDPSKPLKPPRAKVFAVIR